jgi:hypothetical protein
MDAGRNCTSSSHNPHRPSTALANEWELGWKLGQIERAFAKVEEFQRRKHEEKRKMQMRQMEKRLQQLEEARQRATEANKQRRKAKRDEALQLYSQVSQYRKFAGGGRVQRREEVARKLGVSERTVRRRMYGRV